LTAAHVDALVAEHARTGRPVASGYAGIGGVPAVFGARELHALAALRGDVGARAILASAAAATVDWAAGAFDIDSPDDAAVARGVLSIRTS
jgi:molybdenum cofactor cytidylyltransferase